ncbi:hypothetical protein DCS_02266 [Drechmeria coniospora]|uniref:Amidoligase enzyme n=1 Tax=Drechmeria coniospora TaxID=98403 RepID=A0A151GVI7_DRECN|nr:hypothetical protein DCS_02266 [Drechmeria coniospora]KYK61125.1 hypothetical protein DCS_02266 [Drechmeria coniospora]ODA80891.1 hypothetical protein RJ55_03851 [Drechmeria coniospora]
MDGCRFGIELEFMVPVVDKAGSSKHAKPRDDRWPDGANGYETDNDVFGNKASQKSVCAALSDCNLPSARMVVTDALRNDPDYEESSGKEIPIDQDVSLRVWNTPTVKISSTERFKYWYVTDEASIVLGMEKKKIKIPSGCYRWYGVELNSPILSSVEELDHGLPALRKGLASIRNNIKVWLNSECGLHIHVSPADRDVDEIVAKRLAALVFLLERPLLVKLCHPIRQNSTYSRPFFTQPWIAESFTTCASFPIEVNEILAYRERTMGKRHEEHSMFRSLCAILSQDNINELIKLLQIHTGKCALVISDFGTVEFRYPEASFDPDFISAWIHLVRRLLALASSSDEAFASTLCRFYELATTDTSVSWAQWLHELQLPAVRDFFENRVKRYQTDLKNLDQPVILSRSVA